MEGLWVRAEFEFQYDDVLRQSNTTELDLFKDSLDVPWRNWLCRFVAYHSTYPPPKTTTTAFSLFPVSQVVKAGLELNTQPKVPLNSEFFCCSSPGAGVTGVWCHTWLHKASF